MSQSSSEETNISDNTPFVKRKSKKKIWLLSILWLFLILLLLGVVKTGLHFYKEYSLEQKRKKEEFLREQRKNEFKAALGSLVKKDNILIDEYLNMTKNSPSVTFEEYFDKAKKNMDNRDEIIYSVRLLNPPEFQKEIQVYLELLNIENEFVRSEISFIRACLDHSVKTQRWKARDKDFRSSDYYTRDINRESAKAAAEENLKSVNQLIERLNQLKKVLFEFDSKDETCWQVLSEFVPARKISPLLQEREIFDGWLGKAASEGNL